jgi:hypothetical protein
VDYITIEERVLVNHKLSQAKVAIANSAEAANPEEADGER